MRVQVIGKRRCNYIAITSDYAKGSTVFWMYAQGDCPRVHGKLLHYKEVPVPTTIVLSEFVQRIPVVGDIVGYPNLFVVGIILNPASDTSRSFYLRRRVLHKKIDKFFCRDFNKCYSSFIFFLLHNFFQQRSQIVSKQPNKFVLFWSILLSFDLLSIFFCNCTNFVIRKRTTGITPAD